MPRLPAGDAIAVGPRRVWLAYVCAPAGVALPMLIIDVIVFLGNGNAALSVVHSRPDDLLLVVVVPVVIAYVAGAFLLPLYWVFDERGWRGWPYYVPTATLWGAALAWVMSVGSSATPWTYYAIWAASGAAWGAVFSMCLRWPSPTTQNPAVKTPDRLSG